MLSEGKMDPLGECSSPSLILQLRALPPPSASVQRSLRDDRGVRALSDSRSLSRDRRLGLVLALELEALPPGVGRCVDLGVGAGLHTRFSASRSAGLSRFVERGSSSSSFNITSSAARCVRLRVADDLSVTLTSPKSGSSCANRLS